MRVCLPLRIIDFNSFMFLTRCCAVILAGVFFQAQVLAIETTASGEELLKQMAIANRQLNYSGIFTYEHGGTLKTVKVFHAIKAGHEVERLVLLSGPEQEVIRHGEDVNCQRLGDAMLRGNAAGIANISKHHLEKHYIVQVKPDDRIAGRDVNILHVVPLDEHRYGYVLGLDKDTGLLLQSMLIGNNSRVLERFQYVDIQIGDTIADSDLGSAANEHYQISEDAAPCLDHGAIQLSSPNWNPAWLPPGYNMAGHEISAETGRETLIYTDGLSVFSLFIDPDMAADFPQMQAQRGATAAYLSRISVNNRQYVICVVGEIPVETAKLVMQSVRPVTPTAP